MANSLELRNVFLIIINAAYILCLGLGVTPPNYSINFNDVNIRNAEAKFYFAGKFPMNV